MTDDPRPLTRLSWLLRSTALAGAPILLAACGQSAQQATPTGQPSETPAETAIATSAPVQTAAVVDESAAAPVTNVAPVPVAVQADPAAAEPLTDAAAITSEISKGAGIERIRHGDGWAWMRDGKIIRTASPDGKQVAYFRNGSDSPFLVQDDKQAYAYSSGKVSRHYDNGQARTIDSGDRKDAEKLVSRARSDRNDAEHIAATAPARHMTRPTSTPTPSPRHESYHHRSATPTPSPTPSRDHSTMRSTHSSDTMRSSHNSDSMRSTRPTPTPT